MPSHAKVHVISGLPRSGSTLLSAILRQNPRFRAGVSSPVCSLMTAILPRMSGTAEFAPFFDERRRGKVLHSLFWAYHDTAPDGGVIFDTNRSWTARMGLLDWLFPSARVICCVREVPWVIDSMEAMVRRNPMHMSRTFDAKVARNVYGRVEQWMHPQQGLVGAAWSALREAWFGEHAEKLIVIRYESLTRQPRETMDRLYQALGGLSRTISITCFTTKNSMTSAWACQACIPCAVVWSSSTGRPFCLRTFFANTRTTRSGSTKR